MNAQWVVQFKIASSASVALRGASIYQSDGGWRGSLYLSSPGLANVRKATRRAADTVKDRLVKAGVKRSAITILSAQCVG